VIFGVDPERMAASQLVAALREREVQVSAIGPDRIRAVTHYGIESMDITATIAAVRQVMEAA
jgi:hypothetical protein